MTSCKNATITMNSGAKDLFFRELRIFAEGLARKNSSCRKMEHTRLCRHLQKCICSIIDSKVLSKVLELHLLPELLNFAESINYVIEPAQKQNWYPDFTFISRHNSGIKFALDLKTTYRDEQHPCFCNGFTLGSHGEYFIDRTSTKNIQYPYGQYSGHFCLGRIYSRNITAQYDTEIYSVSEIESIPAVIGDFTFFAAEKWRIASDKSGSGNTANIGSIQFIDAIINGNRLFAKAGEELFNDYWANFGKIKIKDSHGKYKPLSSFTEYLQYRGFPESLNNPRKSRR